LWVPTFLIATPMIRSRHVIQLVKMEPLLGTQCRQFLSGTPSTTEFDSKNDASRLVNRKHIGWWMRCGPFNRDNTFIERVPLSRRPHIVSNKPNGFLSGTFFGLYEMPTVSNTHTLSVGSNQIIKTCILN
jgi:hypothetical protein